VPSLWGVTAVPVEHPGSSPAAAFPRDRWLEAFHRGDRTAIEQCYREHHATVSAVVGRMLPDVDAESVSHEIFFRLLTDPKLRSNFRGGNVGAWLTQVAKRCALDHLRRLRRERSDPPEPADESGSLEARRSDALEAKQLVDRFRRERLPPEWAGVFEARFLRGLAQREAAKALGMHRTTLVYREHRIRALLRRFLLREAP
jgi:RNA polymerase sigma-70 factor (ECF subfamily)